MATGGRAGETQAERTNDTVAVAAVTILSLTTTVTVVIPCCVEGRRREGRHMLGREGRRTVKSYDAAAAAVDLSDAESAFHSVVPRLE